MVFIYFIVNLVHLFEAVVLEIANSHRINQNLGRYVGDLMEYYLSLEYMSKFIT